MIHLMGWRNEPRTNPFFMRSHALRSHGLNLLDNERVNIRPRTFFGFRNLDQSDMIIKGKTK